VKEVPPLLDGSATGAGLGGRGLARDGPDRRSARPPNVRGSPADGRAEVRSLWRVASKLDVCAWPLTDDRLVTWRTLMAWVRDTLKWPNPQPFEGLRPRQYKVPPAFA
jgi:hypothetical protein